MITDGTSCEESSHVALQWVSTGVIVVISLGLPIGLFIKLWLKAKDWEDNKRGKYADVAQRMSAELGVDLKQAEFVIRDIVVGTDYSFVMDAFDPRYLYWEALDMIHVIGLGSDADKENLRRFIDGWAVSKKFAGFLSHYKAEAAAEARILKNEIVRTLRTSSDKVFLDADNLSDLRMLLSNVKESDVFILMLTDGVLSRPWCLAELNAAADSGALHHQ